MLNFGRVGGFRKQEARGWGSRPEKPYSLVAACPGGQAGGGKQLHQIWQTKWK